MRETFELSTSERLAVCVRDGHKEYGGRGGEMVLDGVDMNVPKGTIYGLLGASGCGKTTLLGCVVGLKRLTSGDVWVLGGPPNLRNGAKIGYMPQQVSLCDVFTVRESMLYFGRIAGSSLGKIWERCDFLARLLDLPDIDREVGTLSGGEQRRVSLAVALLHEPELLILDEPTVGLDPVLRESIWSYLLELAESRTVTVILTTHYIDEASSANTIGLLRNGAIIAEDAPETLLTKWNVDTLENAFYKVATSESPPEMERCQLPRTVAALDDGSMLKWHVLKALLWKNLLWMRKNFAMALVIFAMPLLTVSLFCLTFGRPPTGLTVAVVNWETSKTIPCGALECNATHLSCHLLGYLNRTAVSLVHYEDELEAIETVNNGRSYAAIVIRSNFTENLRLRVNNQKVSDAVVDVFCDYSNKDIANFFKVYVYRNFHKFIGDYLNFCGISKGVVASPLRIQDPIYGLEEPNMTDFANPGLIVAIAFFSAAALTSGITMIERMEGTLDRTLAMGVSTFEILTAHLLCQSVFMLLQTLSPLVVIFCLFDLTLKGSILHVVALTALCGFCGMCAGLSISSNFEEERSAVYVLLGALLASVLLTGIMWPIEGMNYYLKMLALLMPLTLPAESMRSILQRAWSIDHPLVRNGIVVLCVWTVLFMTISLIGLKLKRS